jgi:hypothetical protein
MRPFFGRTRDRPARHTRFLACAREAFGNQPVVNPAPLDGNALMDLSDAPLNGWDMDEAFLTTHGARHDLWRAVDQDDNILDMPVR